MPAQISRAAYAQMFGPTVGDKVRLADTELFIEVEQDFCIHGEEVKFGGGKVIREIVAETGAKVDIDDEGLIKVSSSDKSQIDAAIAWIKGIVEEAEVGKV